MASEIAPPPPTQVPASHGDVMDAQEQFQPSTLNGGENRLDEPTAFPIDSAIEAPSGAGTTISESIVEAKPIAPSLPDPLPSGPAPVEDVASGIQPIADFLPKDSTHLSHPTPPPDEPLTTGAADIDVHTDVEMGNAEAEVLPPVAPETEEIIPTAEHSLVRSREDDAEDEPAAKRSRLDDESTSIPAGSSSLAVESSRMDVGPSEAMTASVMETVDEPAIGALDAAMETPVPAPVPVQPATESIEVAADVAMPASDSTPAAPVPVVEPETLPSSAGVDVEATQPETEAPKDVPGGSIPSESAIVAETPVDAPISQPASVPASDSQTVVDPTSSVPSKPAYDTAPMTSVQEKSLLEKTKNLKKTKNSMPFLRPVDIVALNIPTYPDIIKNPMDISTMETKLKEGKYHSINDYANDFDLIINNVRRFNGEAHPVTQMGYSLQAYFRKMLESVPTADMKAPPKVEKRRSPSITREKPPRREARIPPAPAQSAAPAPSAQSAETYALQPDGTPQIRRQSSNRPARAIKPPQNREIPYAKPKRKAHQLELRFCEHVIDEIRSPKYGAQNHIFLAPVDPVALNIPQYRQVIKQPMDLGTMANKLRLGEYGTAAEFKKDFDLIIKNCLLFNPVGNPVRDLGIGLQRSFEAIWAEKDKWERKNAPPSNRASSASAEEDDEEEDDDDEEDDDKAQTILNLQKQLAEVQNALLGMTGKPTKKKKTGKPTVKKEASMPLPKVKSKPQPKKKVRAITYDEKQEISESVPRMNESQVATLTNIITSNSEKHRNMGDDSELEIDDLPNHVQAMLLDYVRKIFGNPKRAKAARDASPDDAAALDDDDFEPDRRSSGAATGTKRKKHKPMGKKEQIDQISKIKGQLAQFAGAVTSESASPTGSGSFAPKREDDTSGDDESEESEEE